MPSSPPAQPQFERLFEPLAVGPMTVPNRICETTNTIRAAQMPGFVDDPFIAHHVAKARGGTGWIGSETFLLNAPLPNEAADEFFPGTGAIRIPLFNMPGFTDSLGKFAEAVRETGSVTVCQLTQLNFTMAASSVPIVEAYDWTPHELDANEIAQLIRTYADAAAKFVEAGVDGIEIHCAHETLPQTFLSPALNMRTDEWGGDARDRTRFLREVMLAVKEVVGDRIAVGIRVNGQETREGGYDLLTLREMMSYVAETDTLDFVNVDVGHSWGGPAYVQPSYYGHAIYREAGKALKVDLEDIPILFSGRVNDPGIAEQLLAEGCCDLVGMTRAGIADPEFANKAREGRLSEMRRCIGCNRCIAKSVHDDTPDMFQRPTCSVNPEVGNELFFAMNDKPAEEKKRFVVVGGGPAGCEAARVAAGRGHEVILLEKGKRLGGQINLASAAPGRDSYDDFRIFQENALERLGVDVRLESEATCDEVLALGADAIACATGSVPRVPDTPGIDGPNVVQGWDVLAGRAEVGDRVAVVSQEDYFETLNVADYIADRGKHVEIFHKWMSIGSQIDRYSIAPAMTRLVEHDVAIHTGLRLAAVSDGKLEFHSAFGGALRAFEGFDSVVLVYGSVPDARLYYELKEGLGQGSDREQRSETGTDPSAVRLFLVGSAWVPRFLAEATQHGARVGMEI
ncbi:MAG: FAD-dependent oxidoreductase [Myxococcota bacterium]|jgi:2,4-dienoyl-CoA reductase-like NADH-dependent reductase (Old Yellow Enzyme family)|nr:FAD-dependent oxidoreductase [Myxococcota bacterium]